MLINHVERYIALRKTLGCKFREQSRDLRKFARFAADKGDSAICASTALEWATEAPSPAARHVRLRVVRLFARFLQAENPIHEIPSNPFPRRKHRPVPYIYSSEEIGRLIGAANRLSDSYPLRRQTYATLIGLIAATGIRNSEALNLRLCDVLPEGILQIRRTKFGKDRLIPLHPTVVSALEPYLGKRRRLAVTDDHLFLSATNRRIPPATVSLAFRQILRLGSIAPGRTRLPRIHDLRHTFATRALQQCPTRREAVADHFVALSTYLGHADIKNTYWYLEATPELMTDIAAAGEVLVAKEGI